ncbi:hypothetical protein [Aliarcobacter butzleri]|uniref:hypothetical protein n=1 Tax=Aliarcobacter butzleri TaxID=28197 RepID=UPI002B246477|nr:hypothetical protein [Aliarcobacter butzleri]
MSVIKYDHSLHSRKHLTNDDECYYFIEATNGGFKESASNDLLFNFKMPISSKSNPSWYYRNNAIRIFADYLSSAFMNNKITIIPALTSKRRSSPLFNDRIDKTVELLQSKYSNLIIENVFDLVKDSQEAHRGGTRVVDEIKSNIDWHGFIHTPSEYVFIIDDTLTTGAHFRAWKDTINYYHPNIKVVGVFLALYTWKISAEIELPDFLKIL